MSTNAYTSVLYGVKLSKEMGDKLMSDLEKRGGEDFYEKYEVNYMHDDKDGLTVGYFDNEEDIYVGVIVGTNDIWSPESMKISKFDKKQRGVINSKIESFVGVGFHKLDYWLVVNWF